MRVARMLSEALQNNLVVAELIKTQEQDTIRVTDTRGATIVSGPYHSMQGMQVVKKVLDHLGIAQ